MNEQEAQEHARRVLDDRVRITRVIAAATMTPASLLAYGRVELERLALDVSDAPAECPF